MRSAAAFAVPSDPAASKRHGTHFADLARNPADRARQINDETAQPPPPFRVMLRMITYSVFRSAARRTGVGVGAP
jgi:hypothetical protein